jgi:thymidylate synthase
MINNKSIFINILRDLKDSGNEVTPRGQKVLEIENYQYELPPYFRFFNFKHRKMNLNYIKKEFLWYLKGDRFDTSIKDYASLWKGLINDDGSINSNYGQYIFTGDQFYNVIHTLCNDKDSRRASIMILTGDHLLSFTNDYPCTYALNFRIRNNKLNMSVRMRSQDAIFGMTNDAPAFSFIHEMLYVYLRDDIYRDLELGNYNHVSDSFHIYEKHYNMMDEILEDTSYEEVNCPKILNIDEVNFLLKPNENIPDEFKFTKWLNS